MEYIKYKNKYIISKNTTNMKNSIDAIINSNKSISISKTILSNDDKQKIDQLNIENKTYNFYGDLKSISVNDITDFLGSHDVSDIILSKIVFPFIDAANTSFGWLTIRTSLPNDQYDIPRWHCDGIYYESNEVQYKMVTTLLGPSTIYKENSVELKDIYNKINKEKQSKINIKDMNDILTIDKEYRPILDSAFNNNGHKTITAENYDVIVFVVGDIDRCLIHSEPPINEKRLFLSIVVGTKNQIEDLSNRWKVDMNKSIIT